MLELMSERPTAPALRLEAVGVEGERGPAKQQTSDFGFAALLQEAENAREPATRPRTPSPDADDSAAEASAERESTEVAEELAQKGTAEVEDEEETDEVETGAKKQTEGAFEPLTQAAAVVQETGAVIRVDGEIAMEGEETSSVDLEEVAWGERTESMRDGEEGEEGEAQMDGEQFDDIPSQSMAVRDDGSVGNGPTVLDLLNASELMDPDLVVEKAPEQTIGRLQQAMGTAGGPVLEEMAETVLPQVVRGLATLVRNGAAEMRLQLQPADLGEIELRVRTAEGVVRGEMMVQHPEIKQLLESELTRLRNALAEQGLELDGFDVNVKRDAQFAGMGASQSRSGQGQSRGGDGSTTEPTQTEVPSAPARVSTGDHAVDITI